MVPGFKELERFVCRLTLLVLLFALRLRKYHTDSRVLLVVRRPTCFEVRSK